MIGTLFEFNGNLSMVKTPLQIKWNITETGKTYRFVRRKLGSPVELILRDEYGVPLTGKQYSFRVGAQTYEGTTGEEGLVSQKLPASVQEAELTVWLNAEDPEDTLTWTVNVGSLPPIEDIKGVQVRLNNLGFDCGEVNGVMNEQTKAAVRAFQEFIEDPNPNGELDEPTRTELAKLHDGV